jgi:hypothetical protein
MSLNANVFAQMKPGAFLVSCGSGSVIDEAALAEALRAGRLAGAALDTYEWEPIRPDNPLLPVARDPAMNVLLTPHTASASQFSASLPSSRPTKLLPSTGYRSSAPTPAMSRKVGNNLIHLNTSYSYTWPGLCDGA